jgi:regulator of cell morphogenesis and NO signaling
MNDVTPPLAELTVPEPLARWELAPLPALVDHIVAHYHRRLRDALPHLIEMARMIEARHRDKGACPVGLTALLDEMQHTVLDHLAREENVVFPALVSGSGARVSAPIYVMELEHRHHKRDLLRLRALTREYTPPVEACTTWRALYAGLLQLERELMEHIHLENNVLFRRALAA